MKRALVVLAEGAEEMEVTIIVDVLRRASVDVVLAGLDGASGVFCSRRIVIQPDCALARAGNDHDALILPGGAGGARRLGDSSLVGDLLRSFSLTHRLVGAICAAPTALVKHGVFVGRRMTCHPSVRDIVWMHAEIARTGPVEPVVEDRNLITGSGPGTSFRFALAIASRLVGPERVKGVIPPLMLTP
ncbi:MAG: DJ-1 family glyoxalase III [Polyangiaceae bacterium]